MLDGLTSSRSAGLLVHPTSLPGPFGSGDLGPAAFRFVDFLAAAGQTSWQVLPISPTGYGDSPYQAFSAFAGNPLLVSPEVLGADGLLPPSVLDAHRVAATTRVDYASVIMRRWTLLEQAFDIFEADADMVARATQERFNQDNASWLAPFALFMALKGAHEGQPWTTWEPALVRRERGALDQWADRLERSVRLHSFVQRLFFAQWTRLKTYANERGIRIVGDVPIFVAHDSADCWAHPELFQLDQNGDPLFVAGVPPDYFSATGQLWGNPLYRWERHAADGYAWWIARMRQALRATDLLRLDHFRGFAACWSIPAGATTAETGQWVAGPGVALFTALRDALGSLPLIAEDLGVITPDVEALRDDVGLPGMKVMQFAFDSDANAVDLPHNYVKRCVVYTGTHDNDTTAGWFMAAPDHARRYATRYLALDDDATPGQATAALLRATQASVADVAIVPLQDVLGLDTRARMNYPGREEGNWSWRVSADQLTDALATRLYDLASLYGRR